MESAHLEISAGRSAEWYADFINALPAAVFRESLEGRIVFCNEAMAEMFGFDSAGPMIGYPIVTLYSDNGERDALFHELKGRGRVVDRRVSFKRRDGTPIRCNITARAMFDEGGNLVHLDGLMKEVSQAVERLQGLSHFKRREDALSDFVVLLTEEGNLLDINERGAELLGSKPVDLIGRSIFDFVSPAFRDLVSTHLSIILESGREEGILTILNRDGRDQHLEFRAFVEKMTEGGRRVQLMARNVTERIRYQKEQLSKEKFLGVLEMAGGVAHKLNQPLTIVRNMVTEMVATLPSGDPNYEKMARIHHQIERIHEIAKKLGNIKKYQPMEYVAGIRIVDIDRTS